jgi:hypothetical protein
VGGGLAYAHTGTDTDVQAEIINLTRNVVIMNYDGVIGTPGNVAYVFFATMATVDVDWTEFRYMGVNASGKNGVQISTTSGSCNINRSSFHQFEYGGIYIDGNTANNFTIQNNVTYRLGTNNAIRIPETTASSWTFNNIWIIGSYGYSTPNVWIGSLLGTISNLRIAGIYNDALYVHTYSSGGILGGTVSNIIVHSNSGYGINFICHDSTINTLRCWHNGGPGLFLRTTANLTLNDVDLYGNNNDVSTNTAETSVNVIFNNLKTSKTALGASGYSIYIGTTLGGPAIVGLVINNSQLSYVSGVRQARANDIYIASGYCEIYLNKVAIANAPYFSTTVRKKSSIRFQHYNQSAGDNRTYIYNGTGTTGSIIQTDTSYFRTAAPSVKMTPTSATIKLGETNVMKIPVASGANPTITCYVRQSAAFNGTTRLVVKRNDAIGITADTVLATYAGGNDVDTPPGNFNTLSGQPGAVSADGVLEVYVDCDGTAGYINVDDWNVS